MIPSQQSYFSQSQRVEHASNLFHSEYLEHLRNSSPSKNLIKEYSEILDLEKKNMRTVMSHLLSNNTNSNPTQEFLAQTSYLPSRPLQFSSTFSQSLPRELDCQLRELKTSVSTIDKRQIHLNDPQTTNNNNGNNNERDFKSEIVKLNKEILGLQSDLYKLNTKYISKGFLSPSKSRSPQRREIFTTPQREFLMDNETTVRGGENNQGSRIISEVNTFIERISRADPILLSRYFNSPDNLRRMAAQMDYSAILLNLLQLFNEHLSTDLTRHPPPQTSSKPLLSQTLDAESKPIDFKSYFKTSFTEPNNQGILKKKPTYPQLNPQTQKKTIETPRKTNDDSEMRDSRLSSERGSQEYRLYNNRSESPRFLHEEQGLDIDDIPRKKRVKQTLPKKRRNVDIITNLPKKRVPA